MFNMKKLLSMILAVGIITSTGTNVFAAENLSHYEIEIGTSLRTISSNESDSINPFEGTYIDYIIADTAEKLKTMKANGASDDDMEIFAKNRLFSFRYNFGGRLNPQEEALFNSNVAKGTFCLANAQFAIKYTPENYSGSAHNNNADAFRHTLWNYGMVIDVGYDFAKKWGDAHENGATGQPYIEKRMDLFNNAEGLKLGQDNPNTLLHSTFIKKSKDKVSSGYCRIIKNGVLVKSDSTGAK